MDKKTVVCIDDDSFTRKLINTLLIRHGYNVTCYSSPIDFINSISNTEFDLILMDKEMPTMDGLEAIGKIRQTDSDTPIFVMSGSYIEPQMLNDIGANGFIPKTHNNNLCGIINKYFLDNPQGKVKEQLYLELPN